MQISVPEAVLQMDTEETIFSEPVDTEDYHAMGIGPGLGTSEATAIALIAQLRRCTCPVVVDARCTQHPCQSPCLDAAVA